MAIPAAAPAPRRHPGTMGVGVRRGLQLGALVLGVALSIWAFTSARREEHRDATLAFELQAGRLHALAREVLANYEAGLRALEMLAAQTGGLTRARFVSASATILDRYPSWRAIEWIQRVSESERAALESSLTREAGVPFVIRDRVADDTLVPAQPREEHYVILYAQPLEGNERAIGYDVKTAPTIDVLEAARAERRTRLTGQMTADRRIRLSGQFQLIQSADGAPGIVMFAPVFAAGASSTFLGFVQGVFDAPSLVRAMLGGSVDDGIDVLVVDEDERDPRLRVVYSPIDRAAGPAPGTEEAFLRAPAGIHWSSPLVIGGRRWMVHYRPQQGWVDRRLSNAPWARFAGILTIALLLALVVRQFARSQAEAERAVEERSRELQQSRSQLESLITQIPGLVLRSRADARWTPIVAAGRAQETIGFSGAEIVSGVADFRGRIDPADLQSLDAGLHAALDAGQPYEATYRFRHRDGSMRWLLERGRGVRVDGDQSPVIDSIVLDVTDLRLAQEERQRIERKLLETQKLESLGVLAGGVAHDFNNLLTGILGHAELAAGRLPPGSAEHEGLRQIEAAAVRAGELCRQLLAYAGRGRFLIEALDLGQLVRDTLPLLSLSLSKQVTLEVQTGDQPILVMADATQIRQILMNLVMNASDAIGERPGVVTISTSMVRADAGLLSRCAAGGDLEPGEFASLRVSDTGCGMSAETLARIFDPFYTTKFSGRGLGLAAVLGIVRGHKGALHVESAEGAGATFTLLLPRQAPDARSADTPGRGHRGFYCAGRALVIDDEAAVGDIARRMLATFGFEADYATSGEEGLARLATDPSDAYDLVLLDLVMPGLSGEETLRRIRAAHPAVRVLLVSGYSEAPAVQQGAGDGPIAFLGKPFTKDGLEQQLRVLWSRP